MPEFNPSTTTTITIISIINTIISITIITIINNAITTTTTIRFYIDVIQTLRRPHKAFFRPRAELTETSIAVNH